MRRNERGIALLTCLMALLLLTGIAFGLMYMSDADTLVNSNYRSSQQAYYAALGGLQNVRQRMTPGLAAAPPRIDPPTAIPGNAGSVMYILNPYDPSDTVDLPAIQNPGLYYDNELPLEASAQGISTPSGSSVTTQSEYYTIAPLNILRYKWVRITAKTNLATSPYKTNPAAGNLPVCWNGAREVTVADISVCLPAGGNPPSQNPVYLLTALAVTDSGAQRMVQMEVANDPPITTPAAVDSQDHVNLNGNLDVNAYDGCSCQCTAFDKKGNCTTYGNRSPKTCDASKYSIYANGTVDPPNGSETFESGQTPAIAQNQPWPYDINALVSQFSSVGLPVTGAPYNFSCTPQSGPDPLNCGSRSASSSTGNFGNPPSSPPLAQVQSSDPGYQITYVPGDIQLTGGWNGFGVLVVNGNLDIHGGLNFDGLIIVHGVISFTGGGSDTVNINGAIIAGQQSLIDNTLGGSAVIQYNGCALPGTNRNAPPRMVALRELNF
jgi:hypothetical protein